MRNDNWNTYVTTPYSRQHGVDVRATGCVCHAQVRRVRGVWQERIVDVNGAYTSPGPITEIGETRGAELYLRARRLCV